MKKIIFGAIAMLSLAACDSRPNLNTVDGQIAYYQQRLTDCSLKYDAQCAHESFLNLRKATAVKIQNVDMVNADSDKYNWIVPKPYDPEDPGVDRNAKAAAARQQAATDRVTACVMAYSCGIVFGRSY